jgi:hypothetical protein
LTPKNYPGFDIIAHHPQTHQQAAIQVKTRLIGPKENIWDVQVPKNRERYAPFFVIVAVRKTKEEDPPCW